MARKYINPAEQAYEEGRSTVLAEEAIGLPKKKKKDAKTKTSLAGENIGTKDVVNKLRKGGLSDEDIEDSGIYKFKKPKKRKRSLIAKAMVAGGRKAKELALGGKTYARTQAEEAELQKKLKQRRMAR